MTKENWPALTKAQMKPETKALAKRLKEELKVSPVGQLGTAVTARLSSAAYYSALIFPEGGDILWAHATAHFMAWAFGLKEIIDKCPDIRYLDDLKLMLKHQSESPLDDPLVVRHLNYVPYQNMEGIEFCLSDFVKALQPLRRLFAVKAASEDGLVSFDKSLQTQVIPAMYLESQWRLKLAPTPDYQQYLHNGHYSSCGIITAEIINVFLAQANWNRAVVDKALEALGYAMCLFKDFREARENRLSAVSLLTQTLGSQEKASQEVRELIEEYCCQLERLCLPHIRFAEKDEPLYLLHYTIFYCGVVSRSMYMDVDFVGSFSTA
jgi:hypothetical protein